MSTKRFYYMAVVSLAFALSEEETATDMTVNLNFAADKPFINQSILGSLTERAMQAVADHVGTSSMAVSNVLILNIIPLGEMSEAEWEGIRTASAVAEPVEEADAGECETCKV